MSGNNPDDLGAGAPPSVNGGVAATGLLGVPDNYSVAPNFADVFKPGGMVQSNPGGPGISVPSNAPHLPQYHDGAELDITNLSPEVIARLQQQMAQAGLISKGTKVSLGVTDDATIAAYKRLLEVANRYAVSDSDALSMLASHPLTVSTGDALTGIGGSAATGPRKTTSTNESTQTFTDLDARAIANDTYDKELGADATPHERNALHSALTAYANAHPSISKTTTNYGVDGNTTSHTTSSGGIDSAGVQQLATDQARGQQGYAEYQAAGRYTPLLMQALGATASVP